MPSVKKEHLSNVYSELTNLKKEKDLLQTKFDAVSSELKVLKTEEKESETNFLAIKTTLDDLKEEKNKLQIDFEKVNLELGVFKAEKEQLAISSHNLKSELDTLKKEKEQLQTKFNAVSLELSSLKEDNGQLQSSFVEVNLEKDTLSLENDQLKSNFINNKLKSKNLEKKEKRNKIIFVILLCSIVSLLVMFYVNRTKSKSDYLNLKQNQKVLLDSLQKLKQTPVVVTDYKPEVTYTIQLAIFKNLDIEFNNLENANFKEIVTENGNGYQIGTFTTYKAASTFKEEIKKIGLKDAFLVPYNSFDERIDIKEALKLSNEEEFIKD